MPLYKASPQNIARAGVSYVIFGRNEVGFPDFIDLVDSLGTSGFKIQGGSNGDFSGISVASAGDINKDTYSDIIIGAWEASPLGRTNAGESYVIFGKPSGFIDIDLSSLTTSVGFKIQGGSNGDYSGVSVASAGDINKDGYSDIIIGAREASPLGRVHAGEGYVIFGNSTIGLDPTLAPTTAAPTLAPTAPPSPNLYLGLTESQLAGIASGVGTSLITLGGFIWESSKYYNPKLLGHDHYYSFATSKIPTWIKTTTAAVIQNADEAIDALKTLQMKYTGHNTMAIYNELKDAAEVAKEACTKVVEFVTEEVTNGVPNAKEALEAYTKFIEHQTITLAEYMAQLAVGVELTQVELTELTPI